jgi:hypothetical protein
MKPGRESNSEPTKNHGENPESTGQLENSAIAAAILVANGWVFIRPHLHQIYLP